MASGFLNLGIVLLLAAGLVVAIRRLDAGDDRGSTGHRTLWSAIGELAGRLIHPRTPRRH